jgi:hypothetical protein
MKTVWEYSTNSEAERLIQTAHQIIIGFYKTNNFIVLPYTPNVSGVNIVSFPILPYTKISRFWDEAKKAIITNFPIVCNKKTVEAVERLLQKEVAAKPNFIKTQRLWQKAEKAVMVEICKMLPDKRDVIKKLIICPTSFGTNVSFSWINNKGELIIYLREDQGIHAIVEAIITSLTRDDIYKKLEGLWSETEIITDFLVTETSIAKVLQKYEKADAYTPTLKGVRVKQQAKLLQESAEFYKKLGIPNFDKPFSLNGLIPEINKNPIENLNIKERLILKKLIEKSNSIISFDEIADEVFKGEEEFSLYAISKTIQRLRDKLEANGISGSYIQTLRGKGYVLKN